MGFLALRIMSDCKEHMNSLEPNDTVAEPDRVRFFCWFAGVEIILSAVNDGWSGRPGPLRHQLLLLPFLLLFAFSATRLLFFPGTSTSWISEERQRFWTWLAVLCVGFEVLSLTAFTYEDHHFSRFGYNVKPLTAWSLLAGIVLVAAICWLLRRVPIYLGAVLAVYTGGVWLAIRSFPLDYLRSDMLPVIIWADQRLLAHLNPYMTMHVGSRIYDFPYLPGMLVVFLPAVALGFDVRWIDCASVLMLCLLLYWAARHERRTAAVLLMGLFVLSPFLQYRHELYIEPHWLMLVSSVVLLQRKHFQLAAAAFGISMGLYQLSWVIFPFFALYAWRRERWLETIKTVTIGLAAMFLLLGPFLRAAFQRIANNTVGQWSGLPHALADPINLSYWLTFIVRPSDLKWVQLVVLTILFGYCVFAGRCATLADTLRWMSVALGLFIAMNVLVDGYFYLTLLIILLMYTFSAAGIWVEPTGGSGRENLTPHGEVVA